MSIDHFPEFAEYFIVGDAEVYNALPEFLLVRETRVRVEQRGFRTRNIIVVTTMIDPEEPSKEARRCLTPLVGI